MLKTPTRLPAKSPEVLIPLSGGTATKKLDRV